MSETLIELTIVAVGTSLPEFVTSVVASQKGETGGADYDFVLCGHYDICDCALIKNTSL